MRIYTEDVNRDGIISILDANFEGYTVTPTLGRYHGKDEHSLCIELLDAAQDKVTEVAEQIKNLNHQDSVLIVNETEEEKFV